MKNLKEVFKSAKEEQISKVSDFDKKMKKYWQSRLIGAMDVLDKLSFLKEEGYKITIDNFQPYSSEKARQSYFPCVRINHTTMIIKDGENDYIGVSGLGRFPLMGEKHTYESFIKKLIQ